MRRWLERGVIMVAALASIATSPKQWHLQATPPPQRDDSATLVVVEASRDAMVSLDSLGLAPEPGQHPWPGRATYMVPKGHRLDGISIHGPCHAGCSDHDCDVPPGEYVRVVSTTPIATWHMEASGVSEHVTLQPNKDALYTVSVVASTGHFTQRLDSTLPGTITSSVDSVVVEWPRVQQPTDVNWTVHVTTEGACPTQAPCEPPPDAQLYVGKAKLENW